MPRSLKRIVCTLLCVLFLLPLFPGARAENVVYGAINYTLYPLSRSYMPIYTGGTWFIPHTLITQSVTGVFSSYSEELRYFTLLSREHALTFSLTRNLAFDNQQQYTQYAMKDGNLFYLPMDFVCGYFGFEASVLSVQQGTMIRIKTRSVSRDDLFVSAVKDDLAAKYEEYVALSSPPPLPVSPRPSGSSSTDTPTPTPSPEPTPEPREVFLTFDDGPTKATNSVLDVLDAYDIRATFFLQGVNIEKDRDTVRRVVGSGHSVGLHSYTHKKDVFYATPDAMLDELARCDDALAEAAFVRSRIIRVPYGSVPDLTPPFCDALAEAGYRFWDWSVDSQDSAANTSAEHVRDHTIDAVGKLKGPAVILFHDKAITAEALPAILDYLIREGYVFRQITEPELPYNYRQDYRQGVRPAPVS